MSVVRIPVFLSWTAQIFDSVSRQFFVYRVRDEIGGVGQQPFDTFAVGAFGYAVRGECERRNYYCADKRRRREDSDENAPRLFYVCHIRNCLPVF